MEGNLWLLDEEHNPVLLMQSGDVEQILFSPDGSQIVLSRRRDMNSVDMWVINSSGWHELSGESGIAGNVQFISFSDDGQLVAFYRLADTGQEIWVADVNTASIWSLAGQDTIQGQSGTSGVSFTQVVWIPGSHQLTYVPYHTSPGGDSGPPHDPVQMVEAITREARVLFPFQEGGEISYSVDRKIMVVANESRVRLLSVQNLSQPQTVASYPPICGTDCFIPQPAWNADSAFFLLSLPSEQMNPDEFINGMEQPFNIWKISADGLHRNRLGEFSVVPGVPGLFSFSPDLKRVAYTRGGDTRQLHIANIDGSGDVTHTSGAEFLAWSPDSLHFAFRSDSGQLMDGDVLGNAVLLTNAVGAEFVGWLYATGFLTNAGPAGDRSLYLGTVGGDSTRLVDLGTSTLYDYVVIP
jgi:WD40 repeat protein